MEADTRAVGPALSEERLARTLFLIDRSNEDFARKLRELYANPEAPGPPAPPAPAPSAAPPDPDLEPSPDPVPEPVAGPAPVTRPTDRAAPATLRGRLAVLRDGLTAAAAVSPEGVGAELAAELDELRAQLDNAFAELVASVRRVELRMVTLRTASDAQVEAIRRIEARLELIAERLDPS